MQLPMRDLVCQCESIPAFERRVTLGVEAGVNRNPSFIGPQRAEHAWGAQIILQLDNLQPQTEVQLGDVVDRDCGTVTGWR